MGKPHSCRWIAFSPDLSPRKAVTHLQALTSHRLQNSLQDTSALVLDVLGESV